MCNIKYTMEIYNDYGAYNYKTDHYVEMVVTELQFMFMFRPWCGVTGTVAAVWTCCHSAKSLVSEIR